MRPARSGGDENLPLLRADAGGVVECAVQVAGVPKSPNEQILQGTYRGILEKEPVPVFALWRDDGNGTQRIKLHSNARISRGEPEHQAPSDLAQLQRGDAVTVQFGADGTAVRVTAEMQVLEGVIQESGPLTPHAMPFVQLRGSPKKVPHRP